MPKILYKTADVRNKIIEIFEELIGRRVVVTAFIGDGAEAYLPNPKGVQIICWPKAGGTNPDAIRRLIDSGAKVHFCKSLHMKVYWTRDRGAVISSANLSQNALGAGNLREIGVWIEPGQLDIDRILGALKYKKVSSSDLYELDTAHREYHIRNRFERDESQYLSFPEWHESPHPSPWRLCWWEGTIPLAQSAKQILYDKYGVSAAQDYVDSGKKDDYPKNSWVLCFTSYKERLVGFKWLYVDQVVRVNKSDTRAYEPDYPYQFVQVWPMKRYPLPPFRIDNRFREAVRKAAKKTSWKKMEGWTKPSSNFIELIYQNYS